MSENLRLFLSVEMFGIENEEICIDYFANFQQQICIYEALAKDVVHVLSRIVQLAGQPSDGAALPFEFFFDEVSDMWRVLRGHDVEFCDTKKAWKIFLARCSRVSTPTLI